MRAMILAAGRGERMGTLTETCPKPLLEVAGKPLIVHQIERLFAAGIRELVINLAYRGEQIADRLEDGSALGVAIEYSWERNGALDTGGGIKQALGLLGPKPFIACNADVWSDFDYASLCEPAHQAHLIMVTNPSHNRNGDFSLDNGNIAEHGNNMLTFSGIGVYRPELFADVTELKFPLAPLLCRWMRRGEVQGAHYIGAWLDVGTPERLALASK